MGIAKIRRLVALAAGILMTSCAPHQMPLQGERLFTGTITFRNQGPDRIQVYLIGEKADWLLGRLEPLETAHLRLPESSYATGEESVVLAVLPGWSRSLAPRGDRRAALSLKEYTRNLPGEEWHFVNGQLQGPW